MATACFAASLGARFQSAPLAASGRLRSLHKHHLECGQRQQAAAIPPSCAQQAAEAPPPSLPRRSALTAALLVALQPALLRPAAAAAAANVTPATINTSLTPDWSLYDATDPVLREAAQLLQDALNAPDVQTEEALWTKVGAWGDWCGGSGCVGCHATRKRACPFTLHRQIIEKYGGLDANWVPDLVGRAWGNRGNSRRWAS